VSLLIVQKIPALLAANVGIPTKAVADVTFEYW
jgi:hypothetical protein